MSVFPTEKQPVQLLLNLPDQPIAQHFAEASGDRSDFLAGKKGGSPPGQGATQGGTLGHPRKSWRTTLEPLLLRTEGTSARIRQPDFGRDLILGLGLGLLQGPGLEAGQGFPGYLLHEADKEVAGDKGRHQGLDRALGSALGSRNGS